RPRIAVRPDPHRVHGLLVLAAPFGPLPIWPMQREVGARDVQHGAARGELRQKLWNPAAAAEVPPVGVVVPHQIALWGYQTQERLGIRLHAFVTMIRVDEDQVET